MKQHLANKIYRDCPLLYIDRTPLDVGDGWFDLIYDLSLRLETQIKYLPTPFRPKVTQVKEKFGQLRFYLSISIPKLDELIQKAETKSLHICEICGYQGMLREGSWWLTLCWRHHWSRRIRAWWRDFRFSNLWRK